MHWQPRISILDIYSTSEWRCWPDIFLAMRDLRDPLEFISLNEEVIMESWRSMNTMEDEAWQE